MLTKGDLVEIRMIPPPDSLHGSKGVIVQVNDTAHYSRRFTVLVNSELRAFAPHELLKQHV